MKTIRKTTSVVLTLLMVISVFSVLPLTAGAASITKVDIDGIFEPAANNRFDNNARCTTKGCTIDGISWYDYSNNKWMTSSDRFVKDTVYEVNIRVKADSGYTFADMSSVTGKINSKDATVGKVTMEDPEEYLNFSLKFTATKANNSLISFNINGVTPPVEGQKPSYTYDASSFYYTVEGFEWRNPDNDAIYSSNFVFEAGKKYQARVYVTPKKGYQFSDDMTAKMNDEKAKVSNVAGYNYYEQQVVTYDFTATAAPVQEETTEVPETTSAPADSEITSISINDVAEPQNKKKPVFEATAGDTSYVIDGVSWRNKTGGYWMTEDDTFRVDVTYTVRVYVKAADGYIFNNPTATINGSEATVASRSGYNTKESLAISFDYTLSSEPTTPETEPTTEPKVEPTTEPETQPQTDKPTEPETKPVDPSHTHDWGDWTLTKRATMDEDGEEQRVCKTDPEHVETHVIPRIDCVDIEGGFKFPYTGEKINPELIIKDVDGNILKKDVDYVVTYYNTVNAGAYLADIEYIGYYEGADCALYYITTAKQPMTVKAKKQTVKISKAKKKKVTVKPLTIKKAKGKVQVVKEKKGTDAKIFKKITVNSKTGAITFKKAKYKKGTYKIKLKVTVKGVNYADKTVTKVVKVKFK